MVSKNIGDLVRSMNCYYSNLIEGHNTTPVEIEKALSNEYSTDQKKRALQLEARAHIEVQTFIDSDKSPLPVISYDFILWVHKEFYQRLPEDFLYIQNPDTGKKIRIKPGTLRSGYVQVGNLIPPSPEALPTFLNRFCEAYGNPHLSKIQKIIAVAASHHRLLWIHPFYDGNGRVARLFSHAFLRSQGIGSSLWSISRGLARNVETYKASLMNANQQRQGDLDERGNLTQQGLLAFCEFFLKTCIDQIQFMEHLLEPEELMRRMEIYTKEEINAGRLPKGSWSLIREALLMGEFKRGKAAELTGYQERQGRIVLNTLIAKKLLTSPTPKSPVQLGFPIEVIDRWFPRLYPTVS